MSNFKRNQVEEAISRSIDPTLQGPSNEVVNRLKRLLDIDRSFGRSFRSHDPGMVNFAFYSRDPAGSGTEVHFQEYEAFAILIGLKLLEHGFPQQTVVTTLRRMRPMLEEEHARILKLDPHTLFEAARVKAAAKPGQLYASIIAPIFLVIRSGQRNTRRELNDNEVRSVAICRSEAELMSLIKSRFGLNTTFELVGAARGLREHLLSTQPAQRGRSSK